jgi:hypothetical protein
MLAPTNWIYTNKVLLVALEREDLLAICLSSFFRAWLEKFTGARLEGRLNLSITESVAKFPLPKNSVGAIGIDAADKLNDEISAWSNDNECGLTNAWNAIHAPDRLDTPITGLRKKLSIIDDQVARAYGYTDLDLKCDFRENPNLPERDRWRFAVSEATRRELLKRLLQLNRTRYEAQELS